MFRYDRRTRVLTATGNVVLTFGDITIRARALVANLGTGDVTAEDDVRLDVAGQAVRGTVLTYGAREDYLKNNQNTVYAFLKAMAEAVVLAKRDPAVAKQAIAKYTKTADQKVIDESYEFFAPYWLLDFHVRADAIRTQLGYLDEKEFPQAQNADANEFFDNTFVDNLERSGFFRDIGFPR